MSYPPGQPQPWQQPQPPYQQWPQQQFPPPGPPAPGPKRRHRVLKAFLIGGGGLLVLIIISVAAGGGRQAAPGAAASSAAVATPSAAKSTVAAKPAVTYVVTGTRGGADVTYGPAGSSLSGHVPMRVTKRLGHADYYSIDAQLQGGGKVTVEIIVGGKVISKGTATGGYNIASAEIVQGLFSGKWEDVQS